MPAHAVPSSLPLLLPPPPAVQYAPAEPRFRRCVRKFFAHLFSNLGLFGLVAGYVIVGAFVFRFLEAGNERQQRDRIGRLKNDCLGELWNITGSKSCILLYLLHAILIPTNKKSTTNSQGKKTIIKYSIQDSQNSFMIVAQTAVEIEEILKRKYDVGHAIQLCILIVGSVREPIEVLVFFYGIKYTFFSPIKALDICFKIFHVFHIEYPLQSINVWLFIQKLYYNIVNKYDKPCPLVNQIINEIIN